MEYKLKRGRVVTISEEISMLKDWLCWSHPTTLTNVAVIGTISAAVIQRFDTKTFLIFKP